MYSRPVYRPLRALALALLLLAPVACQDSSSKVEAHMSQGDGYLEDKQFYEAIIEYKNVLQIDPNHAGAHYGLARAFLGNKQLTHAYWEYSETVRLDPTNLDAKLQYGEFLLSGPSEDQESAVARAGEVIAADPTRFEAWVLKGRALWTLDRPDEAEAAFQRAVEVAPDQEGGALMQLAAFYNRTGDRERAEPLYRKITEVEPGADSYAALGGFLAADRERDAEAEAAYRAGLEAASDANTVRAYASLANFYQSRERFDQVEAVLKEGIESQENDLDLIHALARFYDSQGEVAKADAMLLEVTRVRPEDPEPFLALSAYRGWQGDLEGALEAAESAIAADPDHTIAQLRKAELLIDKGYRSVDNASKAEANKAAGQAIVEAVLATDATHPEARFVKAKLELAQGKLDASVADLLRVLNRRPDWAQAHFALGTALFLQHDMLGARSEAVRALELDASLVEAQKLLAQSHAVLGDDQLAAEVGQRVLRSEPANPKLRILVAQSLVRLGDQDEAMETLQAIPEADRDAEVHFAIGRLLYLRNDPEGARAQYAMALDEDPYLWEPLRAMLELDTGKGDIEESAARIRKAADARPDDPRLVQLLGEVELYQGNSTEAETQFKRAIQLDPNDLDAYRNLVRYLRRSGRPREVLGTWEKALESNPESGTLNLIVGQLYELQGRTDQAIARYEDAVRLSPSLAVAMNNLAYLLAENGGSLDRALDLAQEAKELLPNEPDIADTLGWVLYKKNAPSAAIGYLKEAERGFAPDAPQIGAVRHHLALAYEANGEPEMAREVLARALRELEALERRQGHEQPDPAWAGEVRAMLERLGGPPMATPTQDG